MERGGGKKKTGKKRWEREDDKGKTGKGKLSSKAILTKDVNIYRFYFCDDAKSCFTNVNSTFVSIYVIYYQISLVTQFGLFVIPRGS